MSFRTRYAIVAAVGLVALAPAAKAQDADAPVGGVVEPNYTGALGTRVGGEQRPLAFSEQVYSRERVETGEGASTRLQLLDASLLNVSANSTVVLDRFVYDPGTRLGGAVLRLTKGTFRFVSGQMLNEENITIRTPTAAIVVRGTDIEVTVDPSGWTALTVNEGTVSLIPCGPQRAQQVTTGMQARVNRSCVMTVSAPGEPLEAPGPGGAHTEGTTQERERGHRERSDDRGNSSP